MCGLNPIIISRESRSRYNPVTIPSSRYIHWKHGDGNNGMMGLFLLEHETFPLWSHHSMFFKTNNHDVLSHHPIIIPFKSHYNFIIPLLSHYGSVIPICMWLKSHYYPAIIPWYPRFLIRFNHERRMVNPFWGKSSGPPPATAMSKATMRDRQGGSWKTANFEIGKINISLDW